MIRDFPDIQPGWWAENVDPSLTAPEVVEHVEKVHPGHPALRRLWVCASNFVKAKLRKEQQFRCYPCADSTWVWGEVLTERDHRVPGVSRCRGPAGGGCLADRWRQSKVVRGSARSEQGKRVYE